MDKIEIGKRIKERRLSLGMTQSSITDGYMTRNMLSLIESGNALPSLETAEYLAKKLDVSLSYLLEDTPKGQSSQKEKTAKKVRELYAASDYKSILDLLETFDDWDTELSYVCAYSAFNYAKILTKNGSFEEALKYLNLAIEKSNETIYDTSAIKAAVPLYFAIATNVQSPLLELDIDTYEKKRLQAFDYELYKYLTLDFDFDFSTSVFKTHLYAKQLIRKYRFYDAINVLKEIEETKSTDYNAFVLFSVYSDLESCYKQIGDFENAYRYSSRKFNLLNALKK